MNVLNDSYHAFTIQSVNLVKNISLADFKGMTGNFTLEIFNILAVKSSRTICIHLPKKNILSERQKMFDVNLIYAFCFS